MSVSPGAIGGFGANHHLRQRWVFLNLPIMAQRKLISGMPRTFLTKKTILLTIQLGNLSQSFMQAFAAWVARNILN